MSHNYAIGDFVRWGYEAIDSSWVGQITDIGKEGIRIRWVDARHSDLYRLPLVDTYIHKISEAEGILAYLVKWSANEI